MINQECSQVALRYYLPVLSDTVYRNLSCGRLSREEALSQGLGFTKVPLSIECGETKATAPGSRPFDRQGKGKYPARPDDNKVLLRTVPAEDCICTVPNLTSVAGRSAGC